MSLKMYLYKESFNNYQKMTLIFGQNPRANKAFKSNSQRLAFLLCVAFGV